MSLQSDNNKANFGNFQTLFQTIFSFCLHQESDQFKNTN